jgi:hypothetical protein
MPSRIHWVTTYDGIPVFDNHAYGLLKNTVFRAVETRFRTEAGLLAGARGTREGMPILLDLIQRQGFHLKVKQFRLPKRISHKRNPITNYRRYL